MTVGQISDYDSALEEKEIETSIPGRRSHERPIKYDREKYRRQNHIEIIPRRLKGWCRMATGYDRCPTTFFPAICLKATVMFWL